MKRIWILGLGIGIVATLAACAGGDGDAVRVGSFVRLHYSLEADGTMVVPRNNPEEMHLVIGQNAYPEAFERSFLGLHMGDRKVIRLDPDRAFGEIKPELYVRIPKDKLPDGLQEGQIIGRTDQTGRMSGMRVMKVLDDTIVVDQNHPLAGRTLVYHVKVLEVGQ